ncbi:putative dihydroneopterin aldolase [Stappia sp. 22II-S9-Z10]|nr:putative dihydroneopterin aldolase [Stappia sp. 22II-S9-Z10]
MTSATAPLGPDRVFVKDLVRSIEVGILPEEYGVTQRVRFHVGVTLAAGAEAGADGLAFSYVTILEAIDRATDRHVGLLEDLGEALAADLLSDPNAGAVDIMIEKLDRIDGAAVFGLEMRRGRGQAVAR